MLNTSPLIVSEATVAEVVPILFLQAQISGYVHLTVRLAPGISEQQFAQAYNRNEVEFESCVLDEDHRGEIRLNEEVIGYYGVGDFQQDVGPFDGEPDGERIFNVDALRF